MPIIRVELLKGRAVEQKRELAYVMTREAARILECKPDTVHIVFEEVETHDWAVGGTLTSDR